MTVDHRTGAYLALLLADGRLPTGAHTQSAGLEPAFLAGMELAEVPAYVTMRLRTVTEVEAGTAVVARATWLEASDRTAALRDVDEAWRVRTPSAALRAANELLGRSYLRLAGSVWDLGPLTAAGGQRWCRAVVVGCTAAELGLDAASTARVVAFEDVAMVVAAALKLRPFDPALGVRWTAASADAVEDLVERVAGLRWPHEIPARSAPQLEHWAEQHARAERRLFRA